jgi:hypothetical protein
VRIEDRRGEPVQETTVTVDDAELMDLLQGLADLVEGKRDHLHLAQAGGPQLVVRRGAVNDAEPIERQMDWWVGPLVIFAVLFMVIGVVAFIGWAARLIS